MALPKDMYICSQHNHAYMGDMLQLEPLYSQAQANFLLEENLPIVMIFSWKVVTPLH